MVTVPALWISNQKQHGEDALICHQVTMHSTMLLWLFRRKIVASFIGQWNAIWWVREAIRLPDCYSSYKSDRLVSDNDTASGDKSHTLYTTGGRKLLKRAFKTGKTTERSLRKVLLPETIDGTDSSWTKLVIENQENCRCLEVQNEKTELAGNIIAMTTLASPHQIYFLCPTDHPPIFCASLNYFFIILLSSEGGSSTYNINSASFSIDAAWSAEHFRQLLVFIMKYPEPETS